jgi:hypothetical protein
VLAVTGRGDDEFRARRGRQQDVGHRLGGAALLAVLGVDHDAVERDELQRLCRPVVLDLYIEYRVGSGIGDAPELLLAGLHLDDRRRVVAGRRLEFQRHVIDVQVPRRRHVAVAGAGIARRRIAGDGLIADDEHPLRQAGDRRLVILNA